jgi:branched-subunit amino acid aminotransferase/4-amino-4-deoxychorismate lyase
MVPSPTNDHTTEVAEQRISLLNGLWLPHSDLTIHVEDVGFRQGVIAVERLRNYHLAPFARDQHLDRWHLTTSALAIDGLPARSQIMCWLDELLARNDTWVRARGDVGITIVATPGRHVGRATFAMHLNPLDHQLIDRRRRFGQPLVVTGVVQPDSSSWPRGIKTRARIHYYLADRESHRDDPHAVGVLLDQDGTVTETSIANLAVVQSNTVISPPADRVLGGITQQIIEQLAAEASVTWEKQPIHPEQLQRADEILLMGTDGGIWFANSVNRQPVASGQPGPVYSRLRCAFDELVGKRARS